MLSDVGKGLETLGGTASFPSDLYLACYSGFSYKPVSPRST